VSTNEREHWLSKKNQWVISILLCVCAFGLIIVALPIGSQEVHSKKSVSRTISFDTLHIDSREPTKTFSMERAVQYLDDAALAWNRKQWDFNANKKCASCHTTYAYVLARSPLKQSNVAVLDEVHDYLKSRVKNYNSVRPWYDGEKGSPKQVKASQDTEAIMNALALAWYDANITGSLDPTTRKALDQMWRLRNQPDGVWKWLSFDLNPWESNKDAYSGAALAALATAIAPEKYTRTPTVMTGMESLRRYFQRQNAGKHSVRLHDQVILLWAAHHASDLISRQMKQKIIQDMLLTQNADGGWDIVTLLKSKPTRDIHRKRHSDGYATSLVLYVLQQDQPSLHKRPVDAGIKWLKNNQSISGFWLTPSPNKSQEPYLTHMGTAFAVMALAGRQ